MSLLSKKLPLSPDGLLHYQFWCTTRNMVLPAGAYLKKYVGDTNKTKTLCVILQPRLQGVLPLKHLWTFMDSWTTRVAKATLVRPVTQNRRKRNFFSAIIKFLKKREKIISPGAEVTLSSPVNDGDIKKYNIKDSIKLTF